MKLKILFLTVFLFSNFFISAQQMELFVKKGNVSILDKKYSSGEVITLKPGAILITQSETICLLKKDGNIAEIKAKKSYNYKELLKLVSISKSYTSAFIDVATNQQIATKKSGGISTRGNGNDPWEYFPKDSVFILTDSLTISAGYFPLKLLSDIKLQEINSDKIIFFTKNHLNHTLKTPLPGTYTWKYEAEVESEKGNASNIFFVPTAERKHQMLSEFKFYEASLIEFSYETRDLLLQEYRELHKIYPENPKL
jgi:hypothetical protein